MKTRLSTGIFIILFSVNAFSADYFWVGGTGNWSDVINHWATTSGGGTFHWEVPGEGDNVIFDANSFDAPGQVVTIDVIATCHNMDWTGVTNNPTLEGDTGNNLEIWGSLDYDPAMTNSCSGSLHFHSTQQDSVNMGGHLCLNDVVFDGIGEWILEDALNIPGNYLYLVEGTLTTNDQEVNISRFYSKYYSERILNLGSSVFTITYGASNAWDCFGNNFTIDPGASQVIFTASNGGMNFSSIGQGDFYDVYFDATEGESDIRNAGGTAHNVEFNSDANIYYGLTANKIDFLKDGTFHSGNHICDTVKCYGTCVISNGPNTFGRVTLEGDATINGDNNFDYLEFYPGITITFQSGSTQYISDSLIANGYCYLPSLMKASVSGSQSSISFNNPDYHIILPNIYIKDQNVTGGGTHNAIESFDLGNNTGWNITTPVPRDLFWVGVTGNWNDTLGWALSTGGAGGTCPPSMVDNVNFDTLSFPTRSNAVVTLIGDGTNSVYCHNMDWSGVTNNPTLEGASNIILRIYGSLTFDSSMTRSYTGPTWFSSTGTGNTVTSSGHSFGNYVGFSGTGGEWILQDDLNISGSNLYLVNGTLTTNDQDVTVNQLYSRYNTNRTLNMGSSVFTLNYGAYNAFDINGTNMTINPGSSLVKFTASNGGMYYSSAGGVDFYDILCESTGGTSYIRNAGGTFHNIIFNATGRLHNGATINKVVFNQDGVLQSGTYVIDTIEFKGAGLINTGGHTFGKVTIEGSSTINGDNNFDFLELFPGSTCTLQSGSTQTIIN